MPKTKTSKSNKKTKDPKASKRHRTAYILFSIEKCDQVKSENLGLSPKEILLKRGALWKSADSQAQQHFQKLAGAEKVEYEEKSNAYKNKNFKIN